MGGKRIDRSKLFALHSEGLTNAQIARELGASAEQVGAIVKGAGLTARGVHVVDREKVRLLHAEGLTNVQISERIGASRHAVGKAMKAEGLRSNFVSSNILHLPNGMVQCTKCDRELPYTELPWSRLGKYRTSYCRGCMTAAAVANTSRSVPQYLKHRQRALRDRCKKTGKPYELPGGYLADIYERQGGLCFYTDLPMQLYFGTKKPGVRSDSISVDRIDSNEGYIVGNVVLCTSRANTIKSNCTLEEMAEWLPGWHARIVALWGSLGIPTTVVPGWDVERERVSK